MVDYASQYLANLPPETRDHMVQTYLLPTYLQQVRRIAPQLQRWGQATGVYLGDEVEGAIYSAIGLKKPPSTRPPPPASQIPPWASQAVDATVAPFLDGLSAEIQPVLNRIGKRGIVAVVTLTLLAGFGGFLLGRLTKR